MEKTFSADQGLVRTPLKENTRSCEIINAQIQTPSENIVKIESKKYHLNCSQFHSSDMA